MRGAFTRSLCPHVLAAPTNFRPRCFFAQSHTIDGSARHGADCHLGAHLACLSSLHPSHAASIARASIKVGAECVQGSTTVCMQAGSMHILEIKESTHAGFTCARMQIHKMDVWYIIHQCSTRSRIHPRSALNPPTLSRHIDYFLNIAYRLISCAIPYV